MSLGDTMAAIAYHDGAANDGIPNMAPLTLDGDDEARQVLDVLSSEIGITTLLARLKQSIASAKEFALFLKKRSILEDEHANGLKKLCRQSQDSIQRTDHLGGSFAKAYSEMMLVHDRMADNGMQFALSLHQMQEDLVELVVVAEKARKGWKQNGLAAEQRVADVEAAMRKSKAKYDALADEYDRVRTGDNSAKGGKMFGFKGPKSAAQHEEDLHRKVVAADQDYKAKVEAAQVERKELQTRARPETVKALQDIILQSDSGLTLQLQKMASFNEKLLLSNGLSVSPLQSGSGDVQSLRESVLAIDVEKDLKDFVMHHYSKRPGRSTEPKYERNPVLDQSMRSQTTPPLSLLPPPPPSSSLSGTGGGVAASDSLHSPAVATPTSQNYGQSTFQHDRNISYGSIQSSSPSSQQQQQQQQQHASWNSYQQLASSQQTGHSRFNDSVSSSSMLGQGAPQLGVLPFQTSQSSQLSPAPPTSHSSNGPSPPSTATTSAMPVFGVSLTRLYERDALAVPMVVYQCIQAVDLYGLSNEGIYRLSGSVPAVKKLKHMFDTDSASASLDFRNPENFFHDVNSVAGLLKQFFRDLPDPVLPRHQYGAFVEAAKNDDNTVRRDSLHAIINSMPDPNYATLRALTLHLHRVMENSAVNRMNSQNLAIVFGPTLMGTQPGSNIADAGWQVRVVDTILQNTLAIFDDD